MKITGITFLDNGTYGRIKILNNTVNISGRKLKGNIKTSRKFSEVIRGLDDKSIKEEIISRFINENQLDYLSEKYNYNNLNNDFQIGARSERELLLQEIPSCEIRDAVLFKYLNDRYEYLLSSFDDTNAITLKVSNCSYYSDPGIFRLVSKYMNLYTMEKKFIRYLIEILYDGNKISIRRNTRPSIIQDYTDSYDVIGLKKKLRIDNTYNENSYISVGNNSVLNEVENIISEYNRNLEDVAKLQMKMEGF